MRQEPTITDRLDERPRFNPRKVAHTDRKALFYRFGAGALTSIAAGALTLAFGERVGGIFLAFPAILAASLTLIEKEEAPTDAREDARGATVGGAALALFAGVAALTLGHLAGALALLSATAAWLIAALIGYGALWWR
ncbi:MAG: DUF3147 family protein [Actinobacteria bacterium]|jgi:hypothetical protein|nr:MAG: DUF3147 family protein [Actinomycetota bacterium]